MLKKKKEEYMIESVTGKRHRIPVEVWYEIQVMPISKALRLLMVDYWLRNKDLGKGE